MKKAYFIKVVILLLIVLFSTGSKAQEFDLEGFIERNFPVQDLNTNYEDIYEALYQLYQSRINLNQASRQELQSLLLLSNIQIDEFLKHRAVNGSLLSIYELQAIPEFDLETIYQLLPFVKVRETGLQADNNPLLRRVLNEDNNYLIIRSDRTLERKRGYISTEDQERQYLGDPYRIYTRFRVKHSDDFSLGFTAEKDAGEQLKWDPAKNQYGLDYWSFHAQLENRGILKNIVLGDYQLQFGQSLVFGAGFAMGKGSQTVATARRSNLGILPYTSVLETNFFRGIAATIQLTDYLKLTSFYSYNPINGNIDIDTARSAEEYFSSIRLTGFHRTVNELAGKNTIGSQNFGGNLLFNTRTENLDIGINYIHTLYERSFFRDPSKYNQFEFEGTENQNFGIFANYYWRNFHLFGETAISSSNGIGAIGGFIASISPSLQTSFVVRNYAKNFHTFYGTAFGESTRNINENGVYWGVEFQPIRKLRLSGYYDRFNFPWLRFRADGPSKGNEFLGRISYRFSREINLYGQVRVENKERNVLVKDNPNLYGLANAEKRNYILNLDVRPKGIVSMKTRAQFSEFLFNETYTHGMALIQDVNFDFGKFRLSTRYAIFETDDFENRQYVYEKDVLYAFSFPAYQDTGSRGYILLQYKLSKKLQIWARYAQFQFIDQFTIGAGNEEIEGNTRSEVKLQVMFRF